MMPFGQLPILGRLVPVPAVGVVDPVGGDIGVVEVGVEYIGRTALHPDAAQGPVPRLPGLCQRTFEGFPFRLGEAVVPGALGRNAGEAGEKGDLLQVIGKREGKDALRSLLSLHEGGREHGREVGIAVMGPAVHAAAGQDFLPFRTDFRFDGLAPAAHAGQGVDADQALPLAGEGVTVYPGTLGGRKFGRNSLFGERYFIVTGGGGFVLMVQRKRFYAVQARSDQEVAKVRAAGSGQVVVTESLDSVVPVAVAGSRVQFSVGAQLDHSVRKRGARVGIPRKA